MRDEPFTSKLDSCEVSLNFRFLIKFLMADTFSLEPVALHWSIDKTKVEKN